VSEEGDFVWGASAIAKVINRSTQQTFKLLEDHALPARKIRGRWCASRAELLDLAKWPAVAA
jgi:hypothetical protein